MAAASAVDPDGHERRARRRPRRGRSRRSSATASPPANANGAGQVVAAGTLEQLAALRRRPPRQGAGHPAAGRRRLPHPPHVARRRGPRPQPPPTSRRDPGVTLLSNADGATVADGRRRARPARPTGAATRCAGTSACRPCVDAGRHRPRSSSPPAGTLVGLAKRGDARGRHTGREDARRPRGGPAADSRARRRPRLGTHSDRRARGLT